MTARRLFGAGAWLGAAGLVVLATRSLAYGLAEPTPLKSGLQQAAGGPRLVAVTLFALVVGFGAATAVVWLAAVGVRERAALRGLRAPRLQPLRVAAHTVGLTLLTFAGFAALESYLHLRTGLPWHGLECLTGPVHAGAMPILAGLSALAAAAVDAAGHVLRWMRRTLRLLLESPSRTERRVPLLPPLVEFMAPPSFLTCAAYPRPPPHHGG